MLYRHIICTFFIIHSFEATGMLKKMCAKLLPISKVKQEDSTITAIKLTPQQQVQGDYENNLKEQNALKYIAKKEVEAKQKKIVHIVTTFHAIMLNKYASQETKKCSAQRAAALISPLFNQPLEPALKKTITCIDQECLFFLNGICPKEDAIEHLNNYLLILQQNSLDQKYLHTALQNLQQLVLKKETLIESVDNELLVWAVHSNDFIPDHLQQSAARELQHRIDQKKMHDTPHLNHKLHEVLGNIRKSGTPHFFSNLVLPKTPEHLTQ